MESESNSLPLGALRTYLRLPWLRRIVTEALSVLSDRISYPFVSRMSGTYSKGLGTPEHFVKLLLLIEDKRFALHPGVDPIAILRALTFNVCGGVRQGGSTITQQLYNIRRRFLKSPRRTFSYKVRQSVCALCYWTRNSRSSLLAEYVNTVYWGKSYYGLDQAAKGYFKVTRSSLSPAQSFFLAERIAMPNAVSLSRIANLINRDPVRSSLFGQGATLEEVMNLYTDIYGVET